MPFENQTVETVRELNDKEYDLLNWNEDLHGRTRIIVLEDGTRLVPSRDPEGNGSGFFEGLPSDTSELTSASITDIGPMSEDETDARDWIINPSIPAPPVITFDNDIQIFPMQDPEGNGPGVLFEINPDDEVYTIIFERED